MDPHSFIARAEAQRWLGIAEKLLMGHDLVGSKTFAIRARESDPRLEAAEQILAVADTLLAAEKRVVGNNGSQQPDFYAILQLARFVQDTDHIAAQYRRLAVLLNPHQNRFPYSDQAFQLVNDAWAVLSNPMRKSMYDSELDFPPQQQMNSIGFNLEQQHHHQQHHQQQQQQHNFFSINHMGSGHERELSEPPQTFQTRVQQSHQHQQLQQHNFLSQPNPIRPVPVREQEDLFQQREQEQLFQPQVQPFQITSTPQQQTRPPPQPPQPQPPMQPPTPPPPAAPPQPPSSWQQAPPLSQPQQQKHLQPQTQPQQQQQKHLQPQAQSQTELQQQLQQKQRQQRLKQEQLQLQQEQHQLQQKQQEQQQQQQLQEKQRQQQLQQEQQQQQQQLQEKQRQQQLQQEQQQQEQLQEKQRQQLQHEQQQLQLQEKQRQQLQQEEQQRQQQEKQSLEQNDAPVQLPNQVNSNNGVREEEIEIETETESASEIVDESPTFWTACPFCFYMYEYPRIYADCILRCDNCKRAFQTIPIPSPPPIIEGQEAYFCCWGFFPIGVSMSHLEKTNGPRPNSKWTPITPLYDVSSNAQDHLNGRAAPKKNTFVNKSSGPQVYVDDVVDDVTDDLTNNVTHDVTDDVTNDVAYDVTNDVADDVFMGISEPSDDSDDEWSTSTSKKKKVKRKKKGSGDKKRAEVLPVRTSIRNGRIKNLEHGIPVQEGVVASAVPVAESSKKTVGGNPRRQSVRVKKELGKLDLNVEFNNNEGEEPAPGMTGGNRGHGQGEEDNIEGIGFFEGLDEFLSSLPILSVVNDEKGKAA